MALDASVIIYEACKIVGIPCFISMWGPSNPQLLAKPGDEEVEVGKKLEQFRGGMKSNTFLSPALSLFAQSLAELPPYVNYSGYVHSMIFSDGDIFDAPACRKIFNSLFQDCPEMTVDVGLLVNRPNAMMKLMETLAKRAPEGAIKVHQGVVPQELASGIIETLAERLRKSESLKAEPNDEVRAHFRDAFENISSLNI
jgi:hypothetical protein